MVSEPPIHLTGMCFFRPNYQIRRCTRMVPNYDAAMKYALPYSWLPIATFRRTSTKQCQLTIPTPLPIVVTATEIVDYFGVFADVDTDGRSPIHNPISWNNNRIDELRMQA